MDPRQLYFDERFRSVCAYCGGVADTRDHVPAKVLLDEPFPADLPVIEACYACNNGYSRDEAYLACLLECMVCGSASPEAIRRPKVSRILVEQEGLALKIATSRVADLFGKVTWQLDVDRVSRVIMKLARGHAAFELAEPQLCEPKRMLVTLLTLLPDAHRHTFEASVAYHVAHMVPEIGSRACKRVCVVGKEAYVAGWNVIQPGRYRYAVSEGPAVRIVLGEYLACEVVW
jgi:hypothetical protein